MLQRYETKITVLLVSEDAKGSQNSHICLFQLFLTGVVSLCLEADCVAMKNKSVKEAGKWADQSCDNNRGYICQINAGNYLFN